MPAPFRKGEAEPDEKRRKRYGEANQSTRERSGQP